MSPQSKIRNVALALGMLFVGFAPSISHAQSTDAQTSPDNTKVNKRDTHPSAKTADKQKNNRSDINTTASIRKAVVGDKALSTYAHNVKIITRNGTVTLKGPVRSADEQNSIMAKATEVVGSADKVVNQMSVKP